MKINKLIYKVIRRMNQAENKMSMDLRDMRISYKEGILDEKQIDEDPFQIFDSWMDLAKQNDKIVEANWMVVSTVDQDSFPNSRVVLLKEIQDKSFVFYTNYNSQKSQELLNNSKVSLLFYWEPLQKQVRIRGIAKQNDPEVSDEYYNSRPKGSQIGAWASNQSQPIENRQALEEQFNKIEQEMGQLDKIERPQHWGGWKVKPQQIEFWQGRENRMHDRIQFQIDQETQKWNYRRLQP